MYDCIYHMQKGLKPLGSPNRTSCSLVRVFRKIPTNFKGRDDDKQFQRVNLFLT